MRFMGISIATDCSHASGVAQLFEGKIRTFKVYKNKEISELIQAFGPDTVCFNIPLHLSSNPYRSAEKEMIIRGYNPDPQNLGDRKAKIKRAIEIKTSLPNKIEAIETDILSVKKTLEISDPKELQNVRIMNMITKDFEKDAVLAAVTALFYKEDLYEQYGDSEEGFVVIPKK